MKALKDLLKLLEDYHAQAIAKQDHGKALRALDFKHQIDIIDTEIQLITKKIQEVFQ